MASEVDFTVRKYRALVRTACAYGAAQEPPQSLVEVLQGILSGSLDGVMTGQGIYDIQSASNAGQSTSQLVDSRSPGKSEVGDAAEYLLTIAEACLAENPDLEGEALCACVLATFPLRAPRTMGSRFATMDPGV